ncbi:MAG TPA: alpha/beta hydrolase [Streptosporangiaceae bacterium]|jgi:pimeloyl-ACP methyl ester carboxylesterase
MPSTKKTLGIAGAVVGIGAAVGLGAAVGIRRYAVGRARLSPDPEADEPFGTLHGRSLTVLADDGLPLHVEIDGPDLDGQPAPLTLVFCHGYALNQHSWHYQRRDLAGVRMVLWDQRSHGRSGRSKPTHATIDQTGADLYAVLQATVPDGHPVVLVGHSMGGMTIMALAERHPELFGDADEAPAAAASDGAPDALPSGGPKVVGVVLMNTSAGKLKEMTLGLPLVVVKAMRPITPGVMHSLSKRAQLVEQARRAAGDISFMVTRRMAFASKKVSPALVDFLEQMIRSTPIDVIAEFYPALMAHDKTGAVDVIGRVPTVVLTAGADRFTPPAHGAAIAEAIPGAELIETPEAGHVLMLEHPEAVTGALRALLDRVGVEAGPYRAGGTA